MSLRLMLCLSLLLISAAASAARQFTVRDGLSQNNVLAIARDAQGFLWFGTEDGLTRFDGIDFRIYRRDQAGGGPSSNEISALLADGEQLWVGTRRGGLDVLDLRLQRWQRVQLLGLTAAAAVSVILKLPSGDLWVGTDGAGLHRVRFDSAGVAQIKRFQADSAGLPSNRIYALTQGAAGIWVGTRDGIAQIDPVSEIITRPSIPGALDPFALNADEVFEDAQGRLWIGTWESGLFRVDATRSEVKHYLPDTQAGAGLRSTRVVSLHSDSTGRMWFGTGAGISYFVEDCDCIRSLPLDLSGRDVQAATYIVDALSDGDGGLWLGTWGEGVVRVPANAWRISRIRPSERRDGLSGERVRALALDRQAQLWIGSFGGELLRATAQPLAALAPWSFERILRPGRVDVERANNIWSMIVDRAGRVWVGHEAGLDRFDPQSQSWSYFNMASTERIPGISAIGGSHPIPSGAVRALLEAQDGRIWVGTSAGVVVIGADDQIVPVLDPLSAAGTPIRVRAHSLAEDPLGRIWIGSSDGLNLLSAQGQWLATVGSMPASLPSGPIYALRFRDDGSVWAAGSFGVCRSAQTQLPAELLWTCFGEEDGLPAGTVYSLQAAIDGSLWLGSGRGLARVAPGAVPGSPRSADAPAAITIYYESDGLVGDEYLPNTHARGADGQLYFGAENGIVAFDPRLLRADRTAHEIVISEIELGNRPMVTGVVGTDGRVLLPVAPAFLETLSLLHSDRLFGFRLSALEFDRPQAINFEYRLDGFDQEWVSAANRTQISYTNVPPGQYQLRARLRFGLHAWGPVQELLAVHISAPLWARWWFRIAMAGLIVLILWALMRWRVHDLRQRQLELEHRVSERTRELEASAEALRAANQRLFEFSTRDALTNLHNRRHVHDLLARLVDGPGSGAAGLHLAMIDADFFKRINDEHGHAIGDLVLRVLADQLLSSCTDKDILGRYGGEEFICALVGHSAVSALAWAEALRARVAHSPIDAGKGLSVPLTISIGMAAYAPGLTLAEWIANADKALYVAKRQGRNRIVEYTS